MTEKEIKKLMGKYLNGTINKKEERLLEQFDKTLLSKNGETVFKTKDDKKHLKLKLTKSINKKRSSNSSKKWIGIAASIALTACMVLFFEFNSFTTENIEAPAIYHIKTTDWGQKLNIILSDGTKIKLNSGSSIRFPENFNGNTRNVELTGEAFFDVTENKDKPFIIKSGDIKTTVLGTSFNINAYSNTDEIAITLASGKVKVSSNDSILFLNPNEQAVYNKMDSSMRSQQVEINRYIDWKNGIIHITDASLGETVEVLERWYGVTFLFEDENLVNCHITATYDNQTLATVLESIKYVKKGLDYKFLDDNKILLTGNCTD